MRNIHKDVFLALREGVFHDPGIAGRRKLDLNAVRQRGLEVADTCSVIANLVCISLVRLVRRYLLPLGMAFSPSVGCR